MFILDTNVLSAILSAKGAPQVAAWIEGQPEELLFTTSVSQAEILSGLEIMPDGRRRTALQQAAHAMFLEDFDKRVLPFDTAATAAYAEIFKTRRRAGRPIATDLMIAAVARINGATVVTRDSGGFEGCGLAVINPWAET